jgi:hypothetical protein
MNARLLTAAAVIVCLPLQTLDAADCKMAPAFAQPDRQGSTTVAVWQDSSTSALLFADGMNVNTDGTRRSYSVSDFWGEATEKGAINNLCNAMSDGCAGLNADQLKARRVLTQDARSRQWPADLLARTRISPSIIPFRNGKPCPELDGYLVSATALHKANISDQCDIANYVDALETSAIVLPKRARQGVPTPFETRGAKIGDLVAVLSGDGNILRFAVVGDTGPARELGEISVALAGQLLGKSKPPVNYREIRGKPPFQGKGWTVGKTFMLILPKTRNANNPYLTQTRIDADGRAAFDRWGGLERFKACAAIYKIR